MKKIKLLTALVLSLVMCLAPTYALTLDTAEEADAVLAGEATLAADPGIETTHELYGDLLFYEDFEDQSVTSWYGEDATAAYFEDAVQALIMENPDGDGYVADLGYYKIFSVEMAEQTVYGELTFVVDVYGKPDTTINRIGYYAGNTWYDTRSSVSKNEEWTTVQYTIHNVTLQNTPTLALNNTENYYVDNVRVYGKKAETSGAYAEKPADSVPTYGNLVYFDNFSGDTGFTNKADINIAGLTDTSVVKDGYNAVLAESTCPLLPNGVRGITVVPGENGWTYTDGTPLKGTLAIYGEQYVLNTNGTNTVVNAEVKDTLSYPWQWTDKICGGVGANKTIEPQNFLWTTGYSHTQQISDDLTVFGYSANKTDTFWAFRSVAVYFMPETKVTVVNGENTEYIDLYGKTEYTLPELTDEGAYYTAWVDADGNIYDAGTSFNANEVNGKTFTALVATIPLLDEEKGELVLFHGYEADSYKTIEYYNTGYMTSVSWSVGSGLNFNDFAQVTDAADSSNKVLEMTLKDGASYTISGFQYNFTGLNLVPGTFTPVLDVYNRNEGSALNRETHLLTDYGVNLGDYGKWTDKTFTPRTWVKNLEMEKIYVVENTVSDTKDTYKYVIGQDLTQGHTKIIGNSLAYLQYRFTGSGKTSVTVDNYRLYFYPANAFMVKDADVLVMEKGAEDGTYTFKAPSDLLGGEYAANVCYTDGESKYFAGQTVDVAMIAGKTLTLAEAAAENSGKAEIRVSNVAKNNGIRFMASITPSLKAKTNEYGFIVAREDVLNVLGKELTFDLDGEGSIFLRGVAYQLNENGDVVTDKVYSDNEDGSMNFTGVCVGLDLNNKVQVTTKIVARPYVMLEDANGNNFIAYGETYTESLAGVAEALKTAVDGGDEEAADAYESANYDGGNHIDDILAAANN